MPHGKSWNNQTKSRMYKNVKMLDEKTKKRYRTDTYASNERGDRGRSYECVAEKLNELFL